MTYILTCGCESQYGGFPSEWNCESKECQPAIAYGCLCDKHFGEYDARPAQFAPRELSDEEIKDIWNKSLLWALNGESLENDMPMSVYFYKEILKKASKK
jgi:hypothetical protein